MISIVVPVGPEKHHQKWLDECLVSITSQMRGEDEVVLVDDMANLDPGWESYNTKIIKNLWRLGCADSWNIGISAAKNDLCLMVAADDWLHPKCLQRCIETYQEIKDPYGYYGLTIQYYFEDTKKYGDVQTLQCNAALVHKTLWRYTGGFSPEMGIGAPDAAFISILLGNKGKAGNLYKIAEGVPLYFVRTHQLQDTAQRADYQGPIIAVRNILTRDWKPVRWNRFE